MTPWNPSFACALAAALVPIALAGCGGTPQAPDSKLSLTVLSSKPHEVSGGDARIAVSAAPDAAGLTFLLNGRRIDPPLVAAGPRMEGVVTGLADGANTLEVRYAGPGGGDASASLVLTNHPLSGPMFSGPQQQPFVCRTQESGLGQPLVDNQDGIGHPVFDVVGARPVGHSKSCAIKTQIHYFYFNGDGFKPFDAATGYTTPPADLKTVTLNGASVPYVVRVEAGTINRFVYTIAMLAPSAQRPDTASGFETASWNRKLVYWLRGGVGLGHQQGSAIWFSNGLRGIERQIISRILAQGYAVASSSGNEAGVHYNMRLAEETAMMTKERFIEAVGQPKFTIGIGGSGGAVQQYLFAQNRPGLLDAGIPVQSYPDMVTQTIPVADCPLLEQYFSDEVARDPASPWASWSRRALIEGSNASDTAGNPVTNKPGSTECINGWQGAVPTVLNPVFKDPRYELVAQHYGYPADAFSRVKWTHWNDLANIYGTGGDGHAPSPIDNVGVQYGLGALAQGQIGKDEFLRINACVGSWKEPSQFVMWDAAADPFDARNMQRSANCRDPDGVPAPRRAGDLAAMRAAYASGHVFTGQRLDIPMIDVRPYLEPSLNMHNARQAFSVRARLLGANRAAARNQVIWFAAEKADQSARAIDALAVLDRYLSDGAAPAAFNDRCFDASGAVIASGTSVWDGVLNQRPKGACSAAFPIFASPRMVAGDSIKGDIFKCTLKPVATALGDGTYPEAARFSAQDHQWLERIFPQGVCDYRAGDVGRPARW
ncbi:hypothetical protein INH39_15320 [Massilia violaceinigra]|uniref:DUF6351 domain-containing protein n=1 Tax=Massilia violaceinigra TaxID=2045208 RepID=A0ABY4ADN0_9BURK|nr:DUF6351 family protein [Massilia violaceinigra]UOD32901.1 hypothetical protein INH39_15320 [Massilia violaceinigra]